MSDRMGRTRLTFDRPRGGRFQLSAEVAASLRRFSQVLPDAPEAGGVLIGRHILETPDIVVDDITTPMPGDQRTRLRFRRRRASQQAVSDEAWKASGGTSTYLGEWHTHPETCPHPSVIDQLDWRRKLVVDRFGGSLFFVIVAIDEICAWEGLPPRGGERGWPGRVARSGSAGDSTRASGNVESNGC